MDRKARLKVGLSNGRNSRRIAEPSRPQSSFDISSSRLEHKTGTSSGDRNGKVTASPTNSRDLGQRSHRDFDVPKVPTACLLREPFAQCVASGDKHHKLSPTGEGGQLESRRDVVVSSFNDIQADRASAVILSTLPPQMSRNERPSRASDTHSGSTTTTTTTNSTAKELSKHAYLDGPAIMSTRTATANTSPEDTSILDTLFGGLSVGQSSSSTGCVQLAPEKPSGQVSPASQSGVTQRQRRGGPPRNLLPKQTGSKDEGSTRGNDGNSQDRPGIKLAQNLQSRSTRMRCPHFFAVGGRQCETLSQYPRDIIRHLRSHGWYFCAKCSQHFLANDRFDRHSCDRICIHLTCVNRNGAAQVHTHRPGCAFSFEALDTPPKWYALFALLYPNLEPPSWERVCVSTVNATAESSPDTRTTPSLQATDLAESPGLSLGSRHDAVSAPSSPPNAPNYGMGEPARSSNSQPPETTDTAIWEHFQIMTQGSRRQNELIMAHGETIAQQREEMARQRNTLSNLERQVRELQRERRR